MESASQGIFATSLRWAMIHIRPEKPEDIASIQDVTTRAFQGEDKANVIAAIRTSDYFIPELSLVAAQKYLR